MSNRNRAVLLAAAMMCAWSFTARPQDVAVGNDVAEGHRLAALICANCHLAASDQAVEPLLRPPAPPFASIARRSTISADWIQQFLTTTHRELEKPGGMPNPELMDFQIKQVAAYLMSLRAPDTAGGTKCGSEIARVETALNQARTQTEDAGTAAAPPPRRQAKSRSNPRLTITAEKKIEAALARARKLDSEGKDAACVAALAKLALHYGAN
jgi:mono/diheme cytochrome c family protein